MKTVPVSAPKHEDTEAVKHFFDSWHIYRKCLENNYTYHNEALSAFSSALASRQSFGDFLDVACGDAEFSLRLIHEKRISSYTAIDCSHVALDLAKKNTAKLPCAQHFVEGDFFRDLAAVPGLFDTVYLSLSLHHLPLADKKLFFSEVFRKMKPDGVFLLFEPSFAPGESRQDYMRKFTAHAEQNFSALSAPEKQLMIDHVTSCDFPESVETYFDLAESAGFSSGALLFSAPGDILSAMLFSVGLAH